MAASSSSSMSADVFGNHEPNLTQTNSPTSNSLSSPTEPVPLKKRLIQPGDADYNHRHSSAQHSSAQTESIPSPPADAVSLKKSRIEPDDAEHNQLPQQHPSTQMNSSPSHPADAVLDPVGIRYDRKSHPANFILEIKNFSSFLDPDVECYFSREFEACGCQWVLCLWPQGDKNMGVNDHISLYLELVGMRENLQGSDIFVKFKLFVLDQINNKYLTVEADEISRFNEEECVRGFHQFVLLDTFKDVANGYLKDDCCVFGAEVFSVEDKHQIQDVSIVRFPEGTSSSTWKIENFSGTETNDIFSYEFEAGDYECKLMFHPRGFGTGKGTHLSVELGLWQSDASQVYGDFTVGIIDQIHHENKYRTINGWFRKSNPFLCDEEFLSLKDLNDKSKGYIVNNTIIFELKTHGISSSKDY